jgi:DNA-binding IclR family transcriptional regulator
VEGHIAGAGPRTRQGSRRLPDPEEDNQLVLAVIRALEILEAFRPDGPTLGNTALAERTGLPKPTVSRLTYTLMRSGYLTFDRRRREYELGPRAVALGSIALSRHDVRRIAVPLMEQLAQHHGFNVGLGIRDSDVMIYTDACQGAALVGLRLFAGSRVPIMGSAMGFAYLTTMAEAERTALLDQLQPRYADRWGVLTRALDRAAADMATHGYCVSLGGWHEDINGVAAPVVVPGDHRAYVVNVGGPAYMMTERKIRETLGPEVAALAREVRAALAPDATGGTGHAR